MELHYINPDRLLGDKRAGPGCLNSFSASICGALPGLGCQAERQRREVGVIGCYAVKARVWTSAIIQRDLRTPTGPSFGICTTAFIRGLVFRSQFMLRSKGRMAWSSGAISPLRTRSDGWRFRRGCLIGRRAPRSVWRRILMPTCHRW